MEVGSSSYVETLSVEVAHHPMSELGLWRWAFHPVGTRSVEVGPPSCQNSVCGGGLSIPCRKSVSRGGPSILLEHDLWRWALHPVGTRYMKVGSSSYVRTRSVEMGSPSCLNSVCGGGFFSLCRNSVCGGGLAIVHQNSVCGGSLSIVS